MPLELVHGPLLTLRGPHQSVRSAAPVNRCADAAHARSCCSNRLFGSARELRCQPIERGVAAKNSRELVTSA